jgi:hypothetical protein
MLGVGRLLRYTGVGRFCRWYYVLNALGCATYLLARDVALVGAGLAPTIEHSLLEWVRNSTQGARQDGWRCPLDAAASVRRGTGVVRADTDTVIGGRAPRPG